MLWDQSLQLSNPEWPSRKVPGYWDGGIVPLIHAATVLLLSYWPYQAQMQS